MRTKRRNKGRRKSKKRKMRGGTGSKTQLPSTVSMDGNGQTLAISTAPGKVVIYSNKDTGSWQEVTTIDVKTT